MSPAGDAVRNGLLLEGLGKPVNLNAVDWHVRHRNPSASPSEIQTETREYVKHHDDPERWMFGAWPSLTANGEQLAQCLEEKDIDLHRGKGI
jgi:hypothetical protein